MRFSGVVVAVMLVLPLLQRWLLPKVQFLRAADVLAMTLVVAVCAGSGPAWFISVCIVHRGGFPIEV
jgi:hypothetical protein